MLEYTLGVLVIGYIVLQIIEHVVFPVVWSFLQRRKVSMCDLASMIGEAGSVREWSGLNGKIWLKGGIWSASADRSFEPGDEVTVEGIEGLRVIVGVRRSRPTRPKEMG